MKYNRSMILKKNQEESSRTNFTQDSSQPPKSNTKELCLEIHGREDNNKTYAKLIIAPHQELHTEVTGEFT